MWMSSCETFFEVSSRLFLAGRVHRLPGVLSKSFARYATYVSVASRPVSILLRVLTGFFHRPAYYGLISDASAQTIAGRAQMWQIFLPTPLPVLCAILPRLETVVGDLRGNPADIRIPAVRSRL